MIKQTGTGMSIPGKVLKINASYTIEDFIDAFNELEDYLISHKHDYSLDIYPVKISLVDKGFAPNYPQHIVVFEKRRKVDKNSEVGTLLKGAQYMPFDAVKLFKAKYSSKKKKYELQYETGEKIHKPYHAFTQFFEINGDPKVKELNSLRTNTRLNQIFDAIYNHKLT